MLLQSFDCIGTLKGECADSGAVDVVHLYLHRIVCESSPSLALGQRTQRRGQPRRHRDPAVANAQFLQLAELIELLSETLCRALGDSMEREMVVVVLKRITICV